MPDPNPDSSAGSDPARTRYFIIVATRLIGVAGAVFGVVLIGRANQLYPQLVGTGLVLAALAVIAWVPRSLARRWRTPPAP